MRLLNFIFGSPIDSLGQRIMRREALIKELMDTIDEQDMRIEELQRRLAEYHKMLFGGAK